MRQRIVVLPDCPQSVVCPKMPKIGTRQHQQMGLRALNRKDVSLSVCLIVGQSVTQPPVLTRAAPVSSAETRWPAGNRGILGTRALGWH